MKITITTSSQDLETILSAGQEEELVAMKRSSFGILIQNKGASTIYVGLGMTAVDGEGISIENNESFSFEVDTLSDVCLVASGEENTEVFILGT